MSVIKKTLQEHGNPKTASFFAAAHRAIRALARPRKRCNPHAYTRWDVVAALENGIVSANKLKRLGAAQFDGWPLESPLIAELRRQEAEKVAAILYDRDGKPRR